MQRRRPFADWWSFFCIFIPSIHHLGVNKIIYIFLIVNRFSLTGVKGGGYSLWIFQLFNTWFPWASITNLLQQKRKAAQKQKTWGTDHLYLIDFESLVGRTLNSFEMYLYEFTKNSGKNSAQTNELFNQFLNTISKSNNPVKLLNLYFVSSDLKRSTSLNVLSFPQCHVSLFHIYLSYPREFVSLNAHPIVVILSEYSSFFKAWIRQIRIIAFVLVEIYLNSRATSDACTAWLWTKQKLENLFRSFGSMFSILYRYAHCYILSCPLSPSPQYIFAVVHSWCRTAVISGMLITVNQSCFFLMNVID